MKSFWIIGLAAVLGGAGIFSRPVWASESGERPRLWLTPFGGYGFRGSVALADPNYSKLDLADAPVYGLAVGMDVPGGVLEVMWTHQDSSVLAVPVSGGPPPDRFDLNTDQIHLNGLYFPPTHTGHLEPYVMAGVGVTRYAPLGDTTDLNRFSWAIGGGAHVKLTPHLGLRLEGKWNPALASSSGNVFCNTATGRCFASASGELINQFDFTAGATLRL